jgi:ABC-type uncharacterized transport system substrate-binding protein
VKYIKLFCHLLILPVLAGCTDSALQKIVYVNSYHSGYDPSDEITRAIEESFSPGEYSLQILYLDSKRLEESLLKQKTDSTLLIIQDINPDVLIVSDDYAVKYVAEPFLEVSRAPVVFCGVNWSADQYDLPRRQVTGMLEVLPLMESLLFVKSHYQGAARIAILSENSLSEQNNTMLLDTLYRNAGFEPVYHLVNDFEEWKAAFRSANSTEDLVYLPTNGSIKAWDDEAARKFVAGNITKPVFTCDDFMMDFCVFGFTKVPFEQGKWAAESAIRILDGKSPSDIPISRNSQKTTWFNEENAGKIDFSPGSEWINEANKITRNE